MNKSRKDARKLRVSRIRSRIFGSASRPRLVFWRSNKTIYAQTIDDDKGMTLIAAKKNGKSAVTAKELGEEMVSSMNAKGVKQVVFDRRGYKYHGVVKRFVEIIREGGIKV